MGRSDVQKMDANWSHERRAAPPHPVSTLLAQVETTLSPARRRRGFLRRADSWGGRTSKKWTRIGAMNGGLLHLTRFRLCSRKSKPPSPPHGGGEGSCGGRIHGEVGRPKNGRELEP